MSSLETLSGEGTLAGVRVQVNERAESDLLRPISPEQPCGESLEDTPLLASFDLTPVFGLSVPPDTPPEEGERRKVPEWQEIRNNARQTLARSKDLRVLAHFAAASLRTDGLPAFFDALGVAAHWLETYWSQTYPLIEEDATSRRNALNCLADRMAVVDRVRRVPLVSTRQHGAFGLRDIEIAAGQLTPTGSDVRPEQQEIDAAFAATPLEELSALQQSVAAGRQALQRIDTRMREYGGPEAAPDFDTLSGQLLKIERTIGAHLASRPDAVLATPQRPAEASEAGPAAATATVAGPIRSREDAIRAMEAVSAFFRHTEPSSPIPLLLDRARGLVSKSFFDVLADLAPDAVAQVQASSGLRKSE